MTNERRHGFTVPLAGRLDGHRQAVESLADAGYVDAWSAEVDGADAFTPLALTAAWEPRLRLGTAIVSAFTRSPAVIAQCAASLAEAAPGRFILGIGSSSEVIVQRWNGIPFEAPAQRVRDVLRFVREALTGRRIAAAYDSFTIDGFRLQRVPEPAPAILVAALRPAMLRLGAREGDGVILNWVSPADVARIAALVAAESDGPRHIVARVFVCPSDDFDHVRSVARRRIAAYLTVPAYAASQAWLGRADALSLMWELWERGDRGGALHAIPDTVIDELFVHGSIDDCRRKIDAYFECGLTASSVSIIDDEPRDVPSVLEDLIGR